MVTARLGAKRQRRPWKRSFLLVLTAFSSEVKVVVTVIAVISASMQ